jgi:hypothetical protein
MAEEGTTKGEPHSSFSTIHLIKSLASEHCVVFCVALGEFCMGAYHLSRGEKKARSMAAKPNLEFCGFLREHSIAWHWVASGSRGLIA